jgi:hypothetical protein
MNQDRSSPKTPGFRGDYRLQIGLLLGLAVAATPEMSFSAGAGETPGEKAILVAARAAAKERGLELCSYGALANDKSQVPGYFAYLRDRSHPETLRLRYAIFQHTGKTWTVDVKEQGRQSSSCIDAEAMPSKPVNLGTREFVGLSDSDEYLESELALTFFAGELVVKYETGMRRGVGADDNWVALTQHKVGDGYREVHQSALILVLPQKSPHAVTLPPRSKTFVIHGKRTDAGDADVNVRAERTGDRINVAVTVADDKEVPLTSASASDADLLRADHVELWYQSKDAGRGVRQLGIARLGDGSVHARWLYPPKLKATLPLITVPTAGQFVASFAADDLFDAHPFAPEEAHEIAFSAVFSDSDTRGLKQETLVATSMLKWADAETFGKLVWLENGARFPPLRRGSRIELTVTGR